VANDFQDSTVTFSPATTLTVPPTPKPLVSAFSTCKEAVTYLAEWCGKTTFPVTPPNLAFL